MSARLNVVVSQSRSQNPKKRDLEEQIVTGLLGETGVDVSVVPHLYDLDPQGPAMLNLTGISGDLVLCSWLFPRAARWTLDRNKIRGSEGTTLLKCLGESDEDDPADDAAGEDNPQDHEDAEQSDKSDEKERVIDLRNTPSRRIYCLDLRAYEQPDVYLEEVRRIAREASTPTVDLMGWINGQPKPEQLNRYLGNSDAAGGADHAATAVGPEAEQKRPTGGDDSAAPANGAAPTVVSEDAARRWYPVIDFSRCTNCLECIDFCLFGVYGLDGQETILVEQPDNCRKGCPACSRVCPENAIIFPEHKTPTIAGSPEVGGPLKIDLSQLFGAPDPGAPGADKAFEVAARERDEQLLAAGREAVGMSVGMPKRQPAAPEDAPKDDLDRLIDALDELEL